MPQIEKVNLEQKFALFQAHYQPKIVGELNGQLVKLVKFKGDFTWHHHEHEDELFFVVKGSFVMKLRDGDVTIREGEFFIVPRGVEHCPSAPEEVQVMLFEPASTLNTGNVTNDFTQPELQKI
jgi:mannose-6-phosphate isomerase-like protein (cupin superfamily)